MQNIKAIHRRRGGVTLPSRAEFNAFQNRVLGDGGTIQDSDYTKAQIKDLKTSGLYDKASIIAIPGAGKSGKLYNLKPKDADFTFSRNSVKWVLGKSGLLEQVAANVPAFEYDAATGKYNILMEPQRTNLMTYPRSFSHSIYSKSGVTTEGDSSTVGSELFGSVVLAAGWYNPLIGRLVATSPIGLYQMAYFTPSLTSGKLYRVAFTVNSISSGAIFTIAQTSGSGNDAKTVTATGSGYFYSLCTDNTHKLSIYPSVANAEINIDISVKEVSLYSCPFLNVAGTANALQGYKIVESNTTSEHKLGTSYTVSSSTAYTQSIYAKKGERDWLLLWWFDGTIAVKAYFNLNTGTIGTTSNAVATMRSIGDGWYLCSITGTISAGKTSVSTYISVTTVNGIESYAGNGTSGIYICHNQFELGTYPTSAIYSGTEGATVTRLVDAAGRTDAALFPSTGTILIDFVYNGLVAEHDRYLFTFRGTSGKVVYIWILANSNTLYAQILNTTTQYNQLISLSAGRHKVLLSYELNNTALYLDGALIGTVDTSCTIPVCDIIQIGFSSGNSAPVNSIVVIPQRLSASECIALSTI